MDPLVPNSKFSHTLFSKRSAVVGLDGLHCHQTMVPTEAVKVGLWIVIDQYKLFTFGTLVFLQSGKNKQIFFFSI
jgi:hypothetical protein